MLTDTEDRLMNVREAARECGRNTETIRRWIWAGKLPARKLGNQLFVKRSELQVLGLGCDETKAVDRPKFLERATELQNKIRAATGGDFDVVSLIKQSRESRLS